MTATDTNAVKLRDDARLMGVETALLLPRETPLTYVRAASGERESDRIQALTLLVRNERAVVACSAAAAMQALAPKRAFAEQIIDIHTGEALEPRALLERLTRAGYERVELVEGRGQVAARGDLVDVYPMQERYPVRIEFFGDEIDQMRTFDPVTQRAIEQVQLLSLPPAFETPQSPEGIQRALQKIDGKIGFSEQKSAWEQGMACSGGDVLLPLLFSKTETVLDYLPKDAILLIDEALMVDEAARTEQTRFCELVSAMLERGEGAPEQVKLLRSASETMEKLDTPRTLLTYALSRTHPAFSPREVVQFPARNAAQYLGNFDELARDVTRAQTNGETILIFAGEFAERVQTALTDHGVELPVLKTMTRLPQAGSSVIYEVRLGQGFAYPTLKVTALAEYELFGKQERGIRGIKRKNHLLFSELNVGDYIVHEAHGIGRFVKVEPLTVQGNTRDYLLIEYKGGDRLYIPTDQLDRIQKYIGGGDEETLPSLSKLGGVDWENRVSKAKSAAKKLAVDLAALYAARAGEKGHAFAADTAWQKQFEDRFPYEETPDQIQSIADIKADMEKSRPMDRLLCGDVGYGKTEVAMRAAFKAVQDSKQVAILVPTTILAQQHYNTIVSRFSDFPIKAACLSRFQQAKERIQIKKRTADGDIDILVGTHSLLAKDLKFKDLGLLIIDEEHRFGVNHKEQMKELKKTVDVLTLTATPIPRTLNMSLSGIRDISVIETPPEERYPVQTFVLEYTDALLTDAISREMARGGQTYVVSNHVQTMESMARRIEKLVPEVRIIMAHGQMAETQLENAMLEFMQNQADVLLCSTIIESGLDIANVNTLVVIDADRMGLAQLYQLRGRVGRSNRLGYAYFTVQANRTMNEKAAKRLMAIREFTQFGAGFQLAMRDLEIRGAGSLLGAEQHGHISDVGYEYYTKLVRQAVDEAQGKELPPAVDPTVDIPLDAHIPHTYIHSEMQRLKVYRRIADIDGRDALLDVTEELIDRYGEPPEAVENLMRIALIKAYAARGFIQAVTVRDGEAVLRFDGEARIDGGRLIAAISRMQGAQLIATEPPGIRVKQKNVDAQTLATAMPEFLHQVMRCTVLDA
ncbi:MAG: transcription-repair coupling factor [Clostridia bacterium]